MCHRTSTLRLSLWEVNICRQAILRLFSSPPLPQNIVKRICVVACVLTSPLLRQKSGEQSFSWGRGDVCTQASAKLIGIHLNSFNFAKTLSTRIRIFLNPQSFLFGFKNFYVHTYPSVFRSNLPVHTSRFRHVSGFTLVPRTPPGILPTEHAFRLPSLIQYLLGSIFFRHRIKNIQIYPDDS